MSPYIAVLPNSPLLLHAFEQRQFLETKKSFQKVRDELRKRGITNVITIADSPRFERNSFSIYIHPEYELTFADFGDLITKSKVSIWWDAYNRIQSQATSFSPIEPIDQPQIDFGHAVPIHLLEQLKLPTEKNTYLCVNNYHQASLQEQQELGTIIKKALDVVNEPYAILVFGGLYQTKAPHLIKSIQVKNSELREQIVDKNFDFKKLTDDADLMHPSLTHSIQIASSLIPSNQSVKELSFEKDNRTSFFAAEIE